MTDRDLTPAEARAEIEALMGEGWAVQVRPHSCGDIHAFAERGPVSISALASTYRAAVSALKQAWRDAVRPWCVSADEGGFLAGMKAQQFVAGTYGVTEDQLGTDADRVARVLKEDQ